MEWFLWPLFVVHTVLAVVLFFLINLIGKHAIDFGYVSTSLFEEPNESLALNFFIRALFPTVFIILFSSAVVAFDKPDLRLGIIMVVPYYYLVRVGAIFLLNRHRLISWPRYIGHALFGILAAKVAYDYLVLPNRSLIPDLEAAGNELWLALAAFLYAVANKISTSDSPGARRRNAFINSHYKEARIRFGAQIDAKISDDLLKLIVYSVLIYEDYCRPPAIRALERLAFWKKRRTTGIMQVGSDDVLSDTESVNSGVDILTGSWEKYADDEIQQRVHMCISDYNKDNDYIFQVMDVMEILAKRADPSFRGAYDSIYAETALEYIEEIDSSNMTQAEMNSHAQKLRDVVEDSLKNTIKVIENSDVLSEKEVIAFKEAQLKWDDYAKAQAYFEQLEHEGGSMEPLVYNSTLENLTVNRIAELRQKIKVMHNR